MDWSTIKTEVYTNPHRRVLFLSNENFVVQTQADLDFGLFEKTRERRWSHWVGFESKSGRKLSGNEVGLAAYVIGLADDIGACMAGHNDEGWEYASKYLGRTTADGIVYDVDGDLDGGFCIAGPNDTYVVSHNFNLIFNE